MNTTTTTTNTKQVVLREVLKMDTGKASKTNDFTFTAVVPTGARIVSPRLHTKGVEIFFVTTTEATEKAGEGETEIITIRMVRTGIEIAEPAEYITTLGGIGSPAFHIFRLV